MSDAAVGLSFRAEFDPVQIDRLATAAARYRFPALSVWDDLGDPPPGPLLAALGSRDKAARLGFACLAVPKYASWDGVTGLVAHLSAIREGPLFIGLSPGAWMPQVGLKPASVRQLAEATQVLRYLLERRTDGFEGACYTVARGFRLNYEPACSPSLMIGGWGERILRLAGEIADEVKIGGAAAPELPAIARPRLAPGALACGREPGKIGIVLGAATIVDEDRNAALAEARRRAAAYIPVVGALDPVAARDYPDAIAAVAEASDRGDLDAAAGAIPDGLLKRFAFAGTPDDVIRQVEAALSGGASRVDFGSPHGLDPVAGIDLIGTKVLPYFRT